MGSDPNICEIVEQQFNLILVMFIEHFIWGKPYAMETVLFVVNGWSFPFV